MSEEPAMRPLLKASPPMPVGSKVGRYRVRLWRATSRQPFGINFAIDDGKIVIGEDVVHLGLRRGDELVRANHLNAARSDECRHVLAESTYVDLLLQHREFDDPDRTERDASCSWNPFVRLLSAVQQAAGADAFLESQDAADGDRGCCASGRRADNVQPLQVLLSVTKPSVLRTTFEDAIEFEISVHRSSLKQRLGIDFALEPQLPTMSRQTAPKILIAQDVHTLGLRKADQVMTVNGVPYSRAADCQKLLESCSLVVLQLKRLASPGGGLAQVTMPLDVENANDNVDEVVEVTDLGSLQGGRGCGVFCRT
jgi:hypothetical protein